jgi:hypothetical protein
MEKKESNYLMKLATLAIAAFIIILGGCIALGIHFLDAYATQPSQTSIGHNIAALVIIFLFFLLNWTAYERHKRNYQAYKMAKKADGSYWNDLDAARAQLTLHTAHLVGTILFALFTIVMLIVSAESSQAPYEVYSVGASLILAEAASIMVFIKLQ